MVKRRRSTEKTRAKATPRAAARAPRASIGQWLTHNPRIVAGGLLALHLLLAFLAFEPAPHNGGDNAAYYGLAKSLLDGTGYTEIYDPAMPPHTQYPPVFPLMLAGLLVLGFGPWIAFKVLVVLCSAAAVVLSYFWVRRKHRPDLALAVAGLIAISPGVLQLSHWELSDVPFWAFTMAALLAWDRLGATNTKRLLVASALTLVAYFTRSAGLPLIVGAGLWLLWRRRWKQIAIFAAVIAPFAFLWWLRSRTQGGVDYVQQFWFVDPYNPAAGRVDVGGLFKRAWDNNAAYFQRHLPYLLVGRPGGFFFGLAALTGVLAVFGWVRRLRHAHVSELFLPFYIGLLLVWPAVWSGERFLVPVLPLLIFYAAEGLHRLVLRFAATRVRTLTLAAAAIVILLALPAFVQTLRWGSMCTRYYMLGDPYACHTPGYQDFFATAELAGRILPDQAVALSRKPRTFWAMSRGTIKGRVYPFTPEPDSLIAAANQAGARYIILDRTDALSQMYLTPALLKRPAAFCIVYAQGPERAAILGVKPGAETIRNVGADSTQANFQLCGPEYWRSRELMEATLRQR